MLPKPQRLNLKKDFKWIASGKKLESGILKIFIKSGENEYPRVGIAVPSKIFAKATDRNRAKRLTSSAFEALYTALPKSVNILALPKAGINNVKSQDVLLDLETVLKKEQVI